MSSPLLIDIKFENSRKFDRLRSTLGGREVIDINDGGDHPEAFPGVHYALVWKPDGKLFTRLPDLTVLFSLGAGVDHIFQSDYLPDVPIVRFVDHTLTTRMSEWVCLQCLMHLRQQRSYDRQQRERLWQELPQPQASDITVGIMGLGELGRDAARKLKTLGFNVIGWSRSGRPVDGIEVFGAGRLDPFLSSTHMLVGLLPLTSETRGIFNRDVFSKLHRHEEIASPVFINAGRGGSQVEADIIACLEDGTLGSVSLDVFEQEPLAEDSPLWGFEQAILTPHAAAVSDIEALGHYVARQIARFEAGEALENVVDRSLGY